MKLEIGFRSFIVLALVMGGVATASASWPNRPSSATLDNPDTTPPSAPRLIDAAADVGCGRFFLDWKESRDNVDHQTFLRYEVYMDGELVDASVVGDYFLELSVDVEPNSTHTFVVRAVDRSGNVSAPSNAKTETDTCP